MVFTKKELETIHTSLLYIQAKMTGEVKGFVVNSTSYDAFHTAIAHYAVLASKVKTMIEETKMSNVWELIKLGLSQFTNEALQRILDHDGPMLLSGSLCCDGVG